MDRDAVESPFRTYRRRSGAALRALIADPKRTTEEQMLLLHVVVEFKRIEQAIIKEGGG